jgi:hypothetical protein
VDLGVPLELLRERLREAGLEGVEIEARREQRHQLFGTRFLVTRPDGSGSGGATPDGGLRLPGRGVAGHGAAGHGAGAHGGAGHGHRAWREIDAQLAESRLPAPCQSLARRIFRVLAEAEGAVHDLPPERVEFHEVGAWDSIADIVCAAAGLAHLGIDRVLCSAVPVGAGQVRSAHGVLPVPAPATLLLLQGFTLVQGGPAFERTTPTGAAILAAVARPAPDPFRYVPGRVGIGIGKAQRVEAPNLVRAVLAREETGWGDGSPTGTLSSTLSGAASKGDRPIHERIELAAANLDDSNPEWIGYAMERLFAAGALDVSLVAIQMKKNRPGTQVQVLYPPPLREAMLAVLLAEVTTLGVRFQSWERVTLPRERVVVHTSWGPVEGKVARFGERRRFSPEFEACRAIALAQGVPLPEVYRAAEQAFAIGGAVKD